MRLNNGQTLGQNPRVRAGETRFGGEASRVAARAGFFRWTRGLLAVAFCVLFARSAQAGTTSFYVYPYTLAIGPVTFAVIGTNLPLNGVVLVDGKPMATSVYNSQVLIAKGTLPPWKNGKVTVSVAATATSAALATESVPVQATAVTFDVAARFATQAAFGPRPDVVLNIQQLGLKGWITQQLAEPAVTYDPTKSGRTDFLAAVTQGSSLLRLRIAWGLQNFLVGQCIFQSFSCLPYEQTLEKDATGNFRQLMTDVASDANVGTLLNLAGNVAPTDPTQHPNQNFARELMQLYTVGENLLNEDGSLQLDGKGNPIPTYTQAQVVDMSRVFTGWNYPPAVNPAYTGYFGFDYSQPLVGIEGQHDQGSKVILGGLTIPANQGVVQDRKLALDAIFAHPNLPPRIARLMIQHLVKSAPTPAYVQRMAKVFENDGTGVRGNLTALVTAILLDPEARAGDTTMSADDGFLQEPFLFQSFLVSLAQLPMSDDQPDYLAGYQGQGWWYYASVFGAYRPEYTIPGTTINSPEFQLFNNQSAVTRSEYAWALLTGYAPGYNSNFSSWLYTNFTNLPDFLEAVNHLAFHGQMPDAEKASILAYCAGLNPNDLRTQQESALFLALNSDSYTVSH